jgi:hypothetical protein
MKILNSVIAFALCLCLTFSTVGCLTQNETAALINVVGQSVSSIISIEGNPALAATLTTDFTAASTAVANWKQGTPSQDVVQALNLLVKDLDLIPVNAQDKVYITLAIATIQSILAVVMPAATGHLSVAKAKSANVITVKQYKRQFNALVVLNPRFAQARIK